MSTIEQVPTHKLGDVLAGLIANEIPFVVTPNPSAETWTITIGASR